MKYLILIARILVGGLFIFSGLIKLNDPTGTAYKLEEYFEVFSHDFAPFFMSLVPAAMIFSVVLSTLEVVLGVALLINWRPKLVTSLLLITIVFFTILTGYSAILNKVTDCGCFGDFIKLTPWQSFMKDIVLLVLILFLYVNRKKQPEPFISRRAANYTVAITLFLSIFLAEYSLKHLPPFDFLAYKEGANIPTLMKPSGTLRFRYTMEKNGKQETFENYPTDTTYKFIKMDEINPEVKPKITDYRVWDIENNDLTQETFTGKKLFIIIQTVNKADKEVFPKVNSVLKELEGSGIEPIVLTSSDEQAFEAFRHEVQLGVPYYFADATVLKAVIRSNPGFLLVSDGTVKGKWHYNDLPDANTIKQLL